MEDEDLVVQEGVDDLVFTHNLGQRLALSRLLSGTFSVAISRRGAIGTWLPLPFRSISMIYRIESNPKPTAHRCIPIWNRQGSLEGEADVQM